MGLINQLWQNYYSYYYADSTSAKVSGAYERTATKSSDYIVTPYGLDNASSTPFFSSIVIWQAARHEYVAYKLHNPIITTWNHNKLDYSQNQIHDFDMKLNYESVSYYTGIVGESTGDLDMDSGFGVEHYDDVSSPLTGQLNTSGPSFAGNGALEASAESILNTAITQINTAQNTQSLGTTITNKVNAANTALSGLQGFAFPK
jgi:hypothetical protein